MVGPYGVYGPGSVGSAGTLVNDILGGVFKKKGAITGFLIDKLTGNDLGALANLHDAFAEMAMGRGTGWLERKLMGGVMPPYMGMMSPMAAYSSLSPFFGGGYFQGAQLGLGSIVPGMHSMNPLAGIALGLLGGMNTAVTAQMGGAAGLWGRGGLLGNPFMGFLAAGFSGMAGMQGPAGPGAGPLDNSGPLGGQGFGSWNPNAMPGRINNTNPFYEQAHQAEVNAVLSDPSLTVEDKVTLMIMLIMNKMDDDIERQAQYINSLQQQQGNRGGPGGPGGTQGGGWLGNLFNSVFGNGLGLGGAGGNVPGTSLAKGDDKSPSIDVETMKLKRMIDKRSQMFDMLRQIIDKYNQTAKGIIDSIGR